MPLLLYCLSELQSVVLPETGVGGLPVEMLEQNGLCCLFSRSSTRDQILGPAAKQAALHFHRVVARVFEQAGVIPFRFPTILEDETELRGHLSEQGENYRQSLVRLHNLVQMELHLSYGANSSSENRQTEPKPLHLGTGGRQYLRARQMEQRELTSLGVELRRSGENLVRGWRERQQAHALRCFALIERHAVDNFKKQIARLQVPAELLVRVTGPWPASEFIDPS